MLGQVIRKTYKHLDMINPILEKKKDQFSTKLEILKIMRKEQKVSRSKYIPFSHK